MAAQAAPPSAPQRPRALRRALLILALVLALLAALLAASAWWLWTTPGGLAMVVRVVHAVGGTVVRLDQPEGSLRDGFGIGQLTVRTATTEVRIDRLRAQLAHFEMQPWRFDFDRLAAERVAVTVRPSDTPSSQVPDSIAVPLTLSAREFRVGEFTLEVGATALAARAIEATVAVGPAGYRVEHGRFAFGANRATIEGSLDGAAPFAIDARATLQTTLDDKPVAAKLAAGGSLVALIVNADVSGSGASGNAQARIASFDATPLKRLQAHLTGIDPRAWDARAPRADLRVEADLAPAPRAADGAFALRGPASVINAAPGPFDAERIPVRTLKSTVEWRGRQLTLPDFALELARGSAAGTAVLDFGATLGWQIDARLAGVDPSALFTRARTLLVDGTVGARRSGDADDVVAELVNRGELPVRLAVDLHGTAERVVLKAGRLALGKGSADLTGEWQRTGAQALRARAQVTNFEPALLVRGLDARLNGTLDLDGRLQPQPSGRVTFELTDSQLLGRPLTGQGSAQLDAARGLDIDARLALRSARVEARGGLGKAGDGRALEIAVEVPALDELALPVRGALSAHATLRGAWDAPAIAARGSLARLRAGEHSIESLRVVLDHEGGREGGFALRAELANHRFGGNELASLRSGVLTIEGRLAQHRLDFTATNEAASALAASAEGGWQGEIGRRGAWHGQLTQLTAGAPLDLRLLAPAALAVEATQWSLGPADLDLFNARVEGLRAAMDTRGFSSAGRFSGLRPQALARSETIATRTGTVRAQAAVPLELRGQWDLRLADSSDGDLLIERSGGDLLASIGNPIGLRELRMQARVRANQLDAQAVLDAERAGVVRATLAAGVERAGGFNWRLAQKRPWAIDASAALPALEGLNALLSDRVHANLRIGGALDASVKIGGTPADPQASGTVQGSKLRAAWIDQGVRLENGTLAGRLDGDTIVLDELRFAGAPSVRPDDKRAAAAAGTEPGFVSANGRLALRDLRGVIQVAAQRLPLLQRSDRWVIATGGANIEVSRDRVQVNGAVAANAGYVNFTRTDLPSLSGDVVVRRTGDAAVEPNAAEPRVRFGFDLGIDLGTAFYLYGSGLDTRVEGAVRLRSDGRGTVRATGTVEAKDGTYTSFGQRLSIARARLNFQGSPENPGLDILALRTGLPVEVGVTITRTASSPLIRLYSDQGLADAEILSWLVLGRPAEKTSADNSALVRAAAGLLSGSGEGMPAKLARSLGIDDIQLRSGELGSMGSLLPRQSVAGSLRGGETGTVSNEIITVGKRLSDALSVTYEQALSGTANVVELSYQISRRLSLVARAGTDNAIDLVYSLAFD